MSRADRTILVTGATGQQGGAVARHLLADGWRVRALVRDPGSAGATRLADAGAELVPGDLDDRILLDHAVRGAYGVFSVQPADIPPHHAPNELQRGLDVVDAARAEGVQHLVYSSVASADRATGIPHWEIKWTIEQHIRDRGVPATVLRPVAFMENFADSAFGVGTENSLLSTFAPDSTVQLIAVDDIGRFAALAFAAPERFVEQTLELAGDELTPHRIATAIGHDPLVPAPTGPTTPFMGFQADIPALRELHPGLLDFETWLSQEGKTLLREHLRKVH